VFKSAKFSGIPFKEDRKTTNRGEGQFKIAVAQTCFALIALFAFEAAIAAPSQTEIDRAFARHTLRSPRSAKTQRL
jgi:hypothetical protein